MIGYWATPGESGRTKTHVFIGGKPACGFRPIKFRDQFYAALSERASEGRDETDAASYGRSVGMSQQSFRQTSVGGSSLGPSSRERMAQATEPVLQRECC